MAVEWRISQGYTPYPEALAEMEARAAAIRDQGAEELVWMLEHPPLYTAGTSAKRADLLEAERFPVYDAGRGGEFTYHGPGQRVVYLMLDLKKRRPDVRAYVQALEAWIIRALSEFNVQGELREGRVGVWVRRTDKGAPEREDKIAALGVRIRRWTTLHGIAVNMEPDLGHFGGIVPCGIRGHGVTSLADLGIPAAMTDLDSALIKHFDPIFGRGGVFGPKEGGGDSGSVSGTVRAE